MRWQGTGWNGVGRGGVQMERKGPTICMLSGQIQNGSVRQSISLSTQVTVHVVVAWSALCSFVVYAARGRGREVDPRSNPTDIDRTEVR